jgi:hypothetical protein
VVFGYAVSAYMPQWLMDFITAWYLRSYPSEHSRYKNRGCSEGPTKTKQQFS